MGKNLNKALISVLSLGMIVSMCSITVNAVETDNVANWVTMYGDNGNNSITPDTVNNATKYKKHILLKNMSFILLLI